MFESIRDIKATTLDHFWRAYYTLQAVGLIPPIVLLIQQWRFSKGIEDKKALRRYWLKQLLYFVIMFFVLTFLLGAMVGLGYIDPPEGYQKP